MGVGRAPHCGGRNERPVSVTGGHRPNTGRHVTRQRANEKRWTISKAPTQ